MRKLIATVFNYSLDGLLADEGTASATGSSSCGTAGTANPTRDRQGESRWES